MTVLVQGNIHMCVPYRFILCITQQDYLVILLSSMCIEVGAFTARLVPNFIGDVCPVTLATSTYGKIGQIWDIPRRR